MIVVEFFPGQSGFRIIPLNSPPQKFKTTGMKQVYRGNCNSTCLYLPDGKNGGDGMRKIITYLRSCEVYNFDFETMFHLQRALNSTKEQWVKYQETKTAYSKDVPVTCEFESDSEYRKKRNTQSWYDVIENLQRDLWEKNQWFRFLEAMTELNIQAPGVFKTKLLDSEWYLDPKLELEMRLLENLEDICIFNGSLTEDGNWLLFINK